MSNLNFDCDRYHGSTIANHGRMPSAQARRTTQPQITRAIAFDIHEAIAAVCGALRFANTPYLSTYHQS